MKGARLPRKLLVAAVGVATVNYVGGAACGGKTVGGDDPPTSGNLPAPTATVPPTSGNLMVPPTPNTPSTCPTITPIDATKLPWKPPTISPGACTQAELDALATFVHENDNAKYVDWKASVSNPTCRACVFGKDGATWAPLVENAAGQLIAMNLGGCIAIASGSEACGKSYQNWYDCRFEACAECPSGDTPRLLKCQSEANRGACKAAFDAVATVCGDQTITDAESACEAKPGLPVAGSIKAQCIGFDGGDGG